MRIRDKPEVDPTLDEAFEMKGQSWRHFGWALTILLFVGYYMFSAGSLSKTLALGAAVMGFYFLCVWLHGRVGHNVD